MNLILLNSIQPKFKNTKANSTINKKCIINKFKTIEKKKLDNIKETLYFVQKIGQNDIEFVQNMHDNFVQDFETMRSEIVDIVPSTKKVQIDEEDIFDN